MAKKTNSKINGKEYYRIRKVIGHTASGKKVLKNFYGESKKDAEQKADEYLNNKVLIKTATEEGIIKRRNNLYYFEDTPLCPDGTESTLSVSSEYIGLGKNQDLKLRIEALLQKAKNES